MPRPSKFSADDLLDAALEVVAARGVAATIAEISERAGAPVGSLYHRFGSRDRLMVELWLRSIRRFHAGLLEVAEDPDAGEALTASAVHIVRYCREHPDEARAMTLYRQAVAADSVDGDLRAQVLGLNDRVDEAMKGLTVRRYGRGSAVRYRLVTTAVRQLPYGLVRPYIGLAPIPPWLDQVVEAASRAVLELGEASDLSVS